MLIVANTKTFLEVNFTMKENETITLSALFDLFGSDPAYNEDINADKVATITEICQRALGIRDGSRAEDKLLDCIYDVHKAGFIAGVTFARRLGR